jgi:hypothetical protein
MIFGNPAIKPINNAPVTFTINVDQGKDVSLGV